MKLRCENIGLIKDSEIEIDGITILAGDNGTGKSTFSKSLYAFFLAFHDLEQKANKLYEKNVRGLLSPFLFPSLFDENSQEAEQLVKNLTNKENSIEEIEKLLTNFFLQDDIPDNWVKNTAKNIFELKEKNFESIGVGLCFNGIFYGKIENVFGNEEKSEVSLTIKDNPIKVSFKHGSNDADLQGAINLTKDAVYIDDPFVLDLLNNPTLQTHIFETDKRIPLLALLKKEKNPEDLTTPQRIENALKLLNPVCEGEITFKDGRYVFQFDDKNVEDLGLQSISTGLKSLSIIKRLLLNGSIEDNGVLILDEPEVHLHPSWQNRFAEVIVLLQKEFNLHILINTHSFDFVNAIETYSTIHGIRNKCRFYFLNKKKNDIWSEVHDVSSDEDLSKIYASFYAATTEMKRELFDFEEKQNNG